MCARVSNAFLCYAHHHRHTNKQKLKRHKSATRDFLTGIFMIMTHKIFPFVSVCFFLLLLTHFLHHNSTQHIRTNGMVKQQKTTIISFEWYTYKYAYMDIMLPTVMKETEGKEREEIGLALTPELKRASHTHSTHMHVYKRQQHIQLFSHIN